MKLKSISIWQLGTVTNGAGTITLEVDNTANNSGIGALPIMITDTSSNMANFARIHYRPNKESVTSQWQNTGTTSNTSGGDISINITANLADTMDIVVKLQLNTFDPMLTITKTTGGVIGKIAGFPLPITTPAWTPVAFPIP